MKPRTATTLSRTLLRRRRELALTQAEVAERAELATETYARIERGAVMPRADTLARLAHALQISADVLLGVSAGEASLSAAETRSPFGDALDRRFADLVTRLHPSTRTALKALLDALYDETKRRRRR